MKRFVRTLTALLLTATAVGTATPARASNAIKEFRLRGSDPADITVGPDGNLWFVEDSENLGGNRIGRITPSGVLTEFPQLRPLSGPLSIVAGPDGALWFTEFYGSRIGRITTDGIVTEQRLPSTGG